MGKTKVKSAPKPKTLAKKSTVVKKKPQKVKKTIPEPKKTKKVQEDDIEIPKKKLSNKKKNKHQKELEGLKDIDPEFYNFLKTNDKKLLDFDMLGSDSEDEPEDDDKEDGEQAKEDEEDSAPEEESEDEDVDTKFHKPSEKMEVASDEEDDGDDDEEEDGEESNVVTLKVLRNWQAELAKASPSISIIRKATLAFNSALASISGDENANPIYKVDGGAVFNGVLQLCVLHLQPSVYKFLGLQPKSTTPLHKTKKWSKIRGCLRSYLIDLTRLIEQVSSTNILQVLLKHLHQMSPMIISFSTIAKTILKRLIVLWSTSEETIRVLAFLCVLKITRNQQGTMLNHVLKAMYMSYVRNSKFVSPNTLPGINFMRRSLVEMFALDLNIAYQHVFLYIRQLAIHLRNAVILKKKDSFQSVYNWQFVNSIKLWVDLLGTSVASNKPQLQPLVYPLVAITTGVIKLIPTAQYFPLRFHCIHALITLAKESNIFIPLLPFILEVLNSNTFNKKHSVVSMKPMQFTCVLRLTKPQLAENGFRDEVIENVCGLLLEYLAHESASLAFPDLVVPTVTALKSYLKNCRNSNHSRKLKQVLDKIMDNAKFVEEERKKVTFGLKDTSLVQSWETQVKNKGTPLDIYFNSWVKTHEVKKRRQAANTDDINDYDIPSIKRKTGESKKVKKSVGPDGKVVLFPSDDEDEDDDIMDMEDDEEEEEEVKPKKQKKAKKVEVEEEEEDERDVNPDAHVDIVKDLDLDDW